MPALAPEKAQLCLNRIRIIGRMKAGRRPTSSVVPRALIWDSHDNKEYGDGVREHVHVSPTRDGVQMRSKIVNLGLQANHNRWQLYRGRVYYAISAT